MPDLENNAAAVERIERMKEDLAAQAATLALERERLKEMDRRLTRWACELAARAAEIQEREEARTSRVFDFRVCLDEPAANADVEGTDAAPKGKPRRKKIKAQQLNR